MVLSCHKKHTVDRVRGVKGSKVLRTRKIKQSIQLIDIGIIISVVKIVMTILPMNIFNKS